MRALVTGGAGLIGSHVADQLLARGTRVRIYDVLEPMVHRDGKPDWIPAEAEFVRGDIRDVDALRAALDDVDVVFHLAAYGGFFPEIAKLCDVNVTGTARLLETIRDGRFDVRKIVIASSQVVYREGTVSCDRHGPIDPPERSLERLRAGMWEVPCPICGDGTRSIATRDEAPPAAQTPYAVSKYAQERLGLVWSAQTGVPVTALRYPCTYGPRQSIFNPYTGIIAIFSTRVLAGKSPVIYEDGRQVRDLCFVDDVARATIVAAETDAFDGRAINVGSGEPVTVETVARTVLETLDSRLTPAITGDFRPGDMRALFTNPEALASIGFRTRISLREGIGRYVEWIGSRGDIREYFSSAEERLRASGLVQNVKGSPTRG